MKDAERETSHKSSGPVIESYRRVLHKIDTVKSTVLIYYLIENVKDGLEGTVNSK